MEVLLGPLVSAVLLCLVRARKNEDRNLFRVAGVLAGASLLTHPLGLVSFLAFLVLTFPAPEKQEGRRDWQRWGRSALLFGGASFLVVLPYIVFVLREGPRELWQQMVVYQTYCYKRQGFWGGPLGHLRELFRLILTTTTWAFFLTKTSLLVWLAWPPRGAQRLLLLAAISMATLLFLYPSSYINYWIPVFYLPLAVCAAAGRPSPDPASVKGRVRSLEKIGVLVIVIALVASNVSALSYRLLQIQRYDPDQSLAELRLLVEKGAPGRHRILGSSVFLYAFPNEEFRSLFVVSSAMDLRGLSWRQSLEEVSPDVIILDGQLASGMWPSFDAPPHGLREFLLQHGKFLGAVRSGLTSSPTDAEVYEIDPAQFESR